MNSGFLLVKYLKEIDFNKKIYAIGSEVGVIAELKENGFEVLYDEEASARIYHSDSTSHVNSENLDLPILVRVELYIQDNLPLSPPFEHWKF